ncbi:hypothetical protein H2203_005878 [Taxawa tesnikishii (nom. ined.)]|nr:hypothetical protein H2203_005878 [Dothideales sp. JES 119]
MVNRWLLAGMAANGVNAAVYAREDSSSWSLAAYSPFVPTGASSSSSSSVYYGNATSLASSSAAPAPEYTVTDVTTLYTTICPATSYITSGDVTSTVTYLTTSTITSTPTPVLPSSSEALTTVTTTSIEELTSTSIVYETIDVTVTVCASGDCSATSTYVSSSSVSVGQTVWTTTATVAPTLFSSSVAVPTAASSSVPVSEAATSLLSEGAASTESPISVPTSTSSSSTTAPSATGITDLGQVGNSTWGTLETGCFPKWLPRADGSPYLSAPWGNKTTTNSDATVRGDIPTTNVTRSYDFTLTRGRASLTFPGPAIEANWGDMIEVTVHNEIYDPDEGTSLHWHGMLQKQTPWYDGVPSVGQCPIAPGHSFTYKYQAELYGTSWYHAHYSAQYAGGVAGPMMIYGPSQEDYDCDIGPVMMSDWYHIPYFAIVADAVGTNLSLIPPTSDSNLINGRNIFNCSNQSYDSSADWLGSNFASDLNWTCVENAPRSNFTFKAGKTHRLRLVNNGADGIQKFSIDGLSMKVIAVDYVPVQPYTTNVVTLGVAQRTDVLVVAPNDTTASYWMRAQDIGGAACGGSSNPEALAAIYNENANTAVLPTTISTINDTNCANDPLSIQVPEFAVTPSTPSFQQDLDISLVQNATGSYEWRLNNQSFRANFNYPLLNLAAEGNVSYPEDPQWNVYNFDKNSSVVFNLTNNTPFTHPFHLHGHNFYVLSVGTGVWNGSVTNPSNPMRRDTQIVPSLGYLAIQMEADNPGVWPFHCHVAWHLSGGLAINVMTLPEQIPAMPDVISQTCVDWDYYSNHNVVDQIDGGA